MTNINFATALAAPVPLLAAHPLFLDLPQSVQAALLDGAKIQSAPAGTMFFREGEDAREFLLVESGQTEVLRYGINGDDRVFQVFEAGHLVAEAAMFMPHGRYPMCARARTDTVVHRLQGSVLRGACATHAPLAMRMLGHLGQKLYGRVNQVEWLSSSTASQRLAAYLLNLHASQGNPMVQLPLSQRQLALQLGIRAETLSRLLTDWAGRGYVAGKRREWTLHNRKPLEELARAEKRGF
ncbi:Crp/Fnr family transcriptional regulator [Achromobacter seleniivolatilans]|uniref:Crp/Fnr family transcriptional regulator n=1 Tax=Achromobacter seleniivolatilans TaxID=3047478 RepID=A0ABY9M519_9BURK|nr:Crp/Fnr family transcriptional regulator [Achromobacter sp. R39]WMD22094.1 Crp/Fnr family transcriptional regulator [Achromobacter sp. R39]